MQLDQWAKKWNIPDAAIAELRQVWGCIDANLILVPKDTRESNIQSLVKLEASQKGCRLWRNNVGAFHQDGNFIRYGLANDSKAVNTLVKSADLIGIRPIKVNSTMIGLTIGQFLCREVKAANWKYTNTAREQAQLRWIKLIQSFGGDARFATGEGTI